MTVSLACDAYRDKAVLFVSRQAPDAEADMAVVLDIAREGNEAGQLRLTLAPNQRCVFGRQPGGCDVVLEHLSISRQHAHLSMDLNGRCFITDMGSGKQPVPFRTHYHCVTYANFRCIYTINRQTLSLHAVVPFWNAAC